MIDMGVARPSAQGKAMMRTETAAIRPWARRGSGPQIAQTVNAITEISSTAGTNQPATVSARPWIGLYIKNGIKRAHQHTNVVSLAAI